jgi:hypothetical protein
MPSQQNGFSGAAMGAGPPKEPYAESGTHKVSAIYPSREEAEAVRQRLIDGGIGASAVDVLHDHSATVVEEGSDEVLKDMLVDGAIGTAVGTGVGALGTAVLWASGVTLFVASPVVAPLAMLGWFAGVGGLVGAAAGAAATGAPEPSTPRKEGKFSELVMDAIKSGNAVLVARTHDKTEQEVAKKIIGDSLKGRDEVASESD